MQDAELGRSGNLEDQEGKNNNLNNTIAASGESTGYPARPTLSRSVSSEMAAYLGSSIHRWSKSEPADVSSNFPTTSVELNSLITSASISNLQAVSAETRAECGSYATSEAEEGDDASSCSSSSTSDDIIIMKEGQLLGPAISTTTPPQSDRIAAHQRRMSEDSTATPVEGNALLALSALGGTISPASGGTSVSQKSIIRKQSAVMVVSTDDGFVPAAEGEATNQGVHRKLSNVCDGHHVRLAKLQSQMGDLKEPPADLLCLMARRVFAQQGPNAVSARVGSDGRLSQLIDHTSVSTIDTIEVASAKLAPIRTRLSSI